MLRMWKGRRGTQCGWTAAVNAKGRMERHLVMLDPSKGVLLPSLTAVAVTSSAICPSCSSIRGALLPVSCTDRSTSSVSCSTACVCVADAGPCERCARSLEGAVWWTHTASLCWAWWVLSSCHSAPATQLLPLSSCHSAPATHLAPLTSPHSPLTTHHSPLTTHH